MRAHLLACLNLLLCNRINSVCVCVRIYAGIVWNRVIAQVVVCSLIKFQALMCELEYECERECECELYVLNDNGSNHRFQY